LKNKVSRRSRSDRVHRTPERRSPVRRQRAQTSARGLQSDRSKRVLPRCSLGSRHLRKDRHGFAVPINRKMAGIATLLEYRHVIIIDDMGGPATQIPICRVARPDLH